MAFLGIGGGSVPGIDAGALQRINQQNLLRQKNIIQGLNPSLQPLTESYKTQREALSGALMPQAEQQLTSFGKDLAGIGGLEKQQGQQLASNFREQQFQNVPALQSAIREAVGSSGRTGNAAAASAVANPVIDAAVASRNLESQLGQQQLQNEINRKTGFAETGFNTRGKALEDKFGLDTGTIDYLTSIGRGDLINEANSLLGAESQYGANELSIEQARQQNAIAQAQAKNDQRANLISGLATVGGAGLGFGLGGGALGAALGGQLGGTFGNIATGQPTSFDPSLLFLLNQKGGGIPGGSTYSGASPETLRYVRGY